MNSAVKAWREKRERYQYLGQRGKVVSWTRITEAPAGFAAPYIIVMVELAGGKRTVGQLVESEKVEIGEPVVGILRRFAKPDEREVLEYGVMWKKV